tara:strand:+ start:549 stop:965 length:417 start_codon:yes stop_codon:yes gene_type:complete
MINELPKKSTRKAKKTNYVMSEKDKRRMETAFVSVAYSADKDARKDDKVQREACQAVGKTLDEWVARMNDVNPDLVEEIFFQFGCFATATDRKKILQHALAPEGVGERIEAQLESWKADDEAERAAAIETSDKERTSE